MHRLDDERDGTMRALANDARRTRLAEARRAGGFRSVEAAAKSSELSGSTWRSHENGTRDLTEEAAHLYADRLNLNYEWLWNGTGEMRATVRSAPIPNANPKPRDVLSGTRSLPIVGRVKGGNGESVVLDGTITDHVPCPRSLDEVTGAYGLEVLGDSMEPRYFAGEIVYVHPTRPVHRNAHVVLQVRGEDGELHAYVKRFKGSGDGSIVVSQYNPPEELRFDRDTVEAVHLIVQSGIR